MASARAARARALIGLGELRCRGDQPAHRDLGGLEALEADLEVEGHEELSGIGLWGRVRLAEEGDGALEIALLNALLDRHGRRALSVRTVRALRMRRSAGEMGTRGFGCTDLHRARLSMDSTRSSVRAGGQLGGVVDAAQLVAEMKKVAGVLSPSIGLGFKARALSLGGVGPGDPGPARSLRAVTSP